MRLLNIDTIRLEEVHGDSVPPYAILSHTWGEDWEEIHYNDIQSGRMGHHGSKNIKLNGCCKQAKDDGYKYVWIDTCCIDKANAVELGEAINSMFRYYQRAAVCYVYLADVPTADDLEFESSRWFTRGWTLQELVAPKNLSFYDSAWSFLGTKREKITSICKVTGIPRLLLLGLATLQEASVAQRMSWAANRSTKRQEDMAYCLLGIFDISLPMIYGEGHQAFRRLQLEIIRKIKDDSILAWGLDIEPDHEAMVPGDFLAASPADFMNCRYIGSRYPIVTSPNSYNITGGHLESSFYLHTNSYGYTYGMLNCGPEQNKKLVIGIPLGREGLKRPPDTFFRPEGRRPRFFREDNFGSKYTPTRCLLEGEHSTTSRTRRHWFYVDDLAETAYELLDVYPQDRWHDSRVMIKTTDHNGWQRSLAKFRKKGDPERYDYLLVLDFLPGTPPQTRSQMMALSKDSDLGDVFRSIEHMSLDKTKEWVSRKVPMGWCMLRACVNDEFVAGQLMFVIRLSPPLDIEDIDDPLPGVDIDNKQMLDSQVIGGEHSNVQGVDDMPTEAKMVEFQQRQDMEEDLPWLGRASVEQSARTETLPPLQNDELQEGNITYHRNKNGSKPPSEISVDCSTCLPASGALAFVFGVCFVLPVALNLLEGPPNMVSSRSRLAESSITDWNGYKHRTVFFQNYTNGIKALQWDSENRTWTIQGPTDYIGGDNIATGTGLAAASVSEPVYETRLWYQRPDGYLEAIWYDEITSSTRWNRDNTQNGVYMYAWIGTSLAATWLSCLTEACVGHWILASQWANGYVGTTNFSDRIKPTRVFAKSVPPKTGLAVAPQLYGGLADRLALVSEVNVGSQNNQWPNGLMRTSYADDVSDGVSWFNESNNADPLPGVQTLLDPTDIRQFAITLLNDWHRTLLLVLLTNGTIIGGWWESDSQLNDTQIVRLRKSPAASISAIATTLDGMLYCISGTDILEYPIDATNPFVANYKGVICSPKIGRDVQCGGQWSLCPIVR
ncbi:HET-domain-containing protein [Stipitochalara longipes BDJ]|nr:HET-domain-containing protein [Stipitochalara longipes BDJ]